MDKDAWLMIELWGTSAIGFVRGRQGVQELGAHKKVDAMDRGIAAEVTTGAEKPESAGPVTTAVPAASTLGGILCIVLERISSTFLQSRCGEVGDGAMIGYFWVPMLITAISAWLEVDCSL